MYPITVIIGLGDFGATFQYLELRFLFWLGWAGLGWAEHQFNCIAVCLKMERIWVSVTVEQNSRAWNRPMGANVGYVRHGNEQKLWTNALRTRTNSPDHLTISRAPV